MLKHVMNIWPRMLPCQGRKRVGTCLIRELKFRGFERKLNSLLCDAILTVVSMNKRNFRALLHRTTIFLHKYEFISLAWCLGVLIKQGASPAIVGNDRPVVKITLSVFPLSIGDSPHYINFGWQCRLTTHPLLALLTCTAMFFSLRYCYVCFVCPFTAR